jgi:hypothetical protein
MQLTDWLLVEVALLPKSLLSKTSFYSLGRKLSSFRLSVLVNLRVERLKVGAKYCRGDWSKEG